MYGPGTTRAGGVELLLVVKVDVRQVIDLIAHITERGGGVTSELVLHHNVPLLIHGRPKVGVGSVGLDSGDAIRSEGNELCWGAS